MFSFKRLIFAVVGGGVAFAIVGEEPMQAIATSTPAPLEECAVSALLYYRTMTHFADVDAHTRDSLGLEAAAMVFLASDGGTDTGYVREARRFAAESEREVFASPDRKSTARKFRAVQSAGVPCIEAFQHRTKRVMGDQTFATFVERQRFSLM